MNLPLWFEIALKASLLLATAGLAAWALRRSTPRMRHLAWALGLLGALALPLASAWLPAWKLPLLEEPWASTAAPLAATEATATEATDSTPPVASTPPAAFIARSPGFELTPQPTASPVPTTPTVVPPPRASSLTAAQAALGLWLAGALLLLARLGMGQLRARALTRGAEPVEHPGWLDELGQAHERTGLRRAPALLIHGAIQAPMTWGLLRPVVLLPPAALGWSPERREIVLLHELTHIQRGDWAVRVLGQIACALYWFQPLAWLGLHRLTVEQELACDDAVLALGTRPSRYADHLLAVARDALSSPPPLALAMARRSQMETRLMSILSFHRRRPARTLLLAPVLLLVVALIPALAALEPWAEAEASEPAARVTADREMAAAIEELAQLEEKLAPLAEHSEMIADEMAAFEEAFEELENPELQAKMEALEAQFEPFEAEMEKLDSLQEPFADRLQELEIDMEPFQEQLEAIEREMQPLAGQLETIESDMEPFLVEIEALAAKMEPLGERLHALALARLNGDSPSADAEMERVSAEMDQLSGLMEEVQSQLAPVQARMAGLHEQMEPFRQKMVRVYEDMEPFHEKMEEIHKEMEPMHLEMGALHERMAPLYEEMETLHAELEPFHEHAGQLHEQMEPFHQKMEEIHKEMEPFHKEMEHLHRKLETELRQEIRALVRQELEPIGVGARGIDAVVDGLEQRSVHLNDGSLRVTHQGDLVTKIETAIGEAARTAQGRDAVARLAAQLADFVIVLPE